MKNFFKELFDYSHHFNQKVVDEMLANPDKVSERALQLFNHTLNAHQIWNSRILSNEKSFGVWEIHETQALKNIDISNYENSLLILDKFDLNDIINYKNTKGDAFENSLRDMLFHIINHSTYHRAQIATEFRNAGITPLMTDYIFYKR